MQSIDNKRNTSIYTQIPKRLGRHTLCNIMLQLCNMVHKDKVPEKQDSHEIMSQLTETRKV